MEASTAGARRERSASVTDIIDDLFLSVTEGWVNRVSKIVSQEIARQTFTNLAPTLLHKSATCGHYEILDLLLSFGAIVDSRNAQHLSPLHVAATGGFVQCINVLLAYGADVNAKSLDGRTPLYYATYSGNLESVKEIVGHNADINLARPGGWTPLHEACRFGFFAIAEYLIECGAEIGRKTVDAAWTPAHMAASNGQINCLRLLIEKGVDLNAGAGPEHRSTLLHEACYAGHYDCVKLLLEAGADPALTDGSKEYPIHLAARRGYVQCLECLIDWLKSHNMSDIIDAYPALDVSLDEEDFEDYPYEIQKALNNPLHLAAVYGHDRCVELLLDNGARHLVNGMSLFPIVLSTIRQHVSCIRAMLARDPDVVVKSIGRDGFNPLHYLCMKTHGFSKRAIACACILMNAGASLDEVRSEESRLCPLGLAARNGARELVHFLLLNGAYPYSAMTFSDRTLRNFSYCASMIENAQTHARPLIELARNAIRKHLGRQNLAKVFTLPLPPMFQDFIFHGHVPTDNLCDVVTCHL